MTRKLRKLMLPALLLSLLLQPVAAQLASAPAATSPAATGQGALDEAPAEVREYLIKAEVADRIADPLQRCLAFPDVPGNRWPKGLAQAHCHLMYEPRITLPQVQALVDKGAFAELDALFAADLARHFSKTDFSEVIHRDFDAFDGEYESGRVTQRWVEKAPDSPYALAARAVYYRELANAARGGEWAAETPRENFARMREFIDLSVDLYQRALAIEPRLMPAYTGLIAAAKLDSRATLERWAIDAANSMDPGCQSTTGAYMLALTPRWGGSYTAMEGLARTLAPRVAERPLLALNTTWPAVEKGRRAYEDDRYEDAATILREAVALTTHSTAHQNFGYSVERQANGAWPALMHLMAASRFIQSDAYAGRARGRLLLRVAKRPDWAAIHLERAPKTGEDVGFGHLLLGDAYAEDGRVADAHRAYLLALEYPTRRREALIGLALSSANGGLFTKALEYMEQSRRDFPDDAEGWRLRSWILGHIGDSSREAVEDLRHSHERYLTLTAGTSDANALRHRKAAEANLRQIELRLENQKVAP